MEYENPDDGECSPFTDDEAAVFKYEALRKSHITTPHAALFFAILEDAIRCALSLKREQLRREALEWFFSDDYSWPASFVNCCLIVKIEPDYLRRGLIEQFPHVRESLRVQRCEVENGVHRSAA